MKRALVVVIGIALGLTSGGIAAGGQTVRPAGRSVEITCAISRSTIDLGESITVSGRVSPRPRGRHTIVIQRYVFRTRKWIEATTTRTRSDGSFSVSYEPPKAGKMRIRAHHPAQDRYGAAWSSFRVLMVNE
jgi:hypothetical protein